MILIVVTTALITSLFAARHIRRNLLSKMYLNAGNVAFDQSDWSSASKNYRSYLSRTPDDIEILISAQARKLHRPVPGRMGAEGFVIVPVECARHEIR